MWAPIVASSREGTASLELVPVRFLHRDIDRDADVGIPAVIQVVAIVDVEDIDIVVVVPVISPRFRPWVDFTKPITLVLEAWEPADYQEGEAGDAEAVIPAKVSPEAVVGDAVAAISATLLPSAMVGLPVLRAMLLPCAVLDTLLFRRTPRLIVTPPLLSVLSRLVLFLPLLVLRALRRFVLLPWSLLLSGRLVLPLSRLLLGVLRRFILLLSRLLLSVLRRFVLLLSRLLLSVLRRLLLGSSLPCRLSMLLFGPGLLVLGRLLLGVVLLFAVLLLLRINWSRGSQDQRKKCRADNSNWFHKSASITSTARHLRSRTSVGGVRQPGSFNSEEEPSLFIGV